MSEIKIKIGEQDFTVEQAKKIYKELSQIFGNQVPFPFGSPSLLTIEELGEDFSKVMDDNLEELYLECPQQEESGQTGGKNDTVSDI